MGCGSSSHGLSQPLAHHVQQTPEIEKRAAKVAAPGQFHCDYVLGRKLGAGSFASVYSARRADGGGDFAVKVVGPRFGDTDGHRVDSKRQHAIEKEVVVMRALPHSPNLVELYSFYGGEGLSYLVMERCDMDLLPFLESIPLLTEVAFKLVFEDMVSGIATCHAAGVVHRDVKCENFVVARGRGVHGCVKLCDFGLASRVIDPSARQLSGICGTPVYMAPEMLQGEWYGASVDVWALGVLVYVLLFGAWPYMPATPSEDEVKTAIQLGSPAPDFNSQPGLPKVSAECALWVRALLCRDPTGRPSAEQALTVPCFRKRWSRVASPDAELRSAAVRRAVAAARVSSELDRALASRRKRQDSEASTSASGDSSFCRSPVPV